MMSVEQSMEYLAGETEVLEEKHAQLPLSPPQIPHDLPRTGTWIAAAE
jgi:hypothetical protein